MATPEPTDRAAFAPESAERERVHDLLRRFGTNPTSFFVRYDAPWRYFFGREVEGVVCYIQVKRSVVAWGDPLCAPEDTAALLREFLDEMRGRKLRTSLLALQEGTARLALATGCSVLKIAEEPGFDLLAWQRPRGDRGKKLRWCVNHARRAGVTVDEYRPNEAPDPDVEGELADVQRAWEAVFDRQVVHSFLQAAPMDQAQEKRIFLARRAGRIEAFLACSPVYGRDGWYLEDLIRLPSATNGATELLIVEAMGMLRDQGASYATLGMAPLRGSDQQIDRRARWLIPPLRWAFAHFDRRYHFVSLSRYKAKFGPTDWEPRYAAFSPARPTVTLARAVMSVLDPDPVEPPAPPQRSTERALIAIQAVVWTLASVVVLFQEHLADPVSSSAGLLAPVGFAGIALGALLFTAGARMGRGDGMIVRLMAIVLEGILVLGAVSRIRDGRGVGLEIVAILLAGAVLIGLVRRPSRPAAQESPATTPGA